MQLESQNHPSLADMLHLKQLMLDGFIKCTRAVLESSSFEKTARIIFDTCRELTGATAGYVALLNDAGTENEVLFLESGGLPCTVAPDLPMPIRGLRAEAYRSCKAVYHNDFMQSPWVKYMPHGHVVLHNVLFAPLVLEGKTVGLIGIANKKGGFTEQDAAIASALGEIAAIALRNSRFVDLLKTSEDRFRALTENTTDITAIISPEGIIRYCTPSLEKLHGIAPEKIIGTPLLSFFHPDDQDSCNNVLTTLASGSVESMRIEDIRIRFSQKTWTHFDVLFTSMIDHPSVKGIVITCRDITEHLAMEERLRQAHKMEAIRTLCGGIAHDFNNNLSAMIGYAELGLYEVGTITVAGHYFKQILNGCERARKLIQQISAFSGINVFELKPVAVSQLLEEAVQQCRPSLPPHVSLTVENRCSDTSIKGSSAQISQMIFHLLSNALLSLPDEGGTITVVLDAVTLHETTRMLDFEIPPGDYLRLSVSDTGCGIDPSILGRIFDPFFTTRDIGQGSGMGLAVVHGVVLRHGGGIAVESEPGKGTSFHILLPKVLVSQLKIAHGAKQ